MSADRLRTAIHKKRPEPPQLDKPKPDTTWGLFAEDRLTEIEDELKAIRNRIDSIMWAVIGTVALAIFEKFVDVL